jgi:hypothetical protein
MLHNVPKSTVKMFIIKTLDNKFPSSTVWDGYWHVHKHTPLNSIQNPTTISPGKLKLAG